MDSKGWGPAEQTGLTQALTVLKRRSKLVVAVTCVIVAAALAWAFTRTATYQAHANVLLASQNLAQALTGTSQQPLSDTEQARIPLTQASLASNPDVIRSALKESGMPQESASAFLGHATVGLAPNSDILVFTVQEPTRAKAINLADAWATAFSQYRFRLDTAPIEQALKGLDQQLATNPGSRSISSALRDDLLAKRQQLMTLEALQTSNARVVRRADEAKKAGLGSLKIGIIALIIGLCCAILLALLRDRTDLRVRSAETLERLLQLPAVGRLPPLTRALRARPTLIVERDPMGGFSRSLRALRAQLELALDEAGACSVGITSALPDEGKTTIAANLAYSMARTGRHVIVADLDLRRPAMHRVFEVARNQGLVDCLFDGLPLDRALIPIDTKSNAENAVHGGSLQLLPAGMLTTDPSELFRSPSFARTMRELHGRADVLILDTAPLLPVADTVTLSPHVQAMGLVVRLPGVKLRVVDELGKTLRALRCPTVGFATNLDDSWSDFGYDYGPVDETAGGSDLSARGARTA
jgi:Mrp family chromosome partitioning ATPase/capsular polysaccharide biosynthesis protein